MVRQQQPRPRTTLEEECFCGLNTDATSDFYDEDNKLHRPTRKTAQNVCKRFTARKGGSTMNDTRRPATRIAQEQAMHEALSRAMRGSQRDARALGLSEKDAVHFVSVGALVEAGLTYDPDAPERSSILRIGGNAEADVGTNVEADEGFVGQRTPTRRRRPTHTNRLPEYEELEEWEREDVGYDAGYGAGFNVGSNAKKPGRFLR
jgi:hypothetical protein